MSKDRLVIGLHVEDRPGGFVETAVMTIAPSSKPVLAAFRLQPPPTGPDDWVKTLAWAVRGALWEMGGFLSDVRFLGLAGPQAVHAAAKGLADTFELPVAVVPAAGDGPKASWMAPGLMALAEQASGVGRSAVLWLGEVAHLVAPTGDGGLLAFDVGPASAAQRAWLAAHDIDDPKSFEALAALGAPHGLLIDQLLDQPFFDAPPPKALHPDDVSAAQLRGLSLVDGAATLVALTAHSAMRGLAHGARPDRLILCGSGRESPALAGALRRQTGLEIMACDRLGWNDEALPAIAAAFVAIDALSGLPNAGDATSSEAASS